MKRISDEEFINSFPVMAECLKCEPVQGECDVCKARYVADAQCLADQKEHDKLMAKKDQEIERLKAELSQVKKQTAEEIFKEVEKLYKERLSTKSHPELTWYNWWHVLKAKYGGK